MNQRNDRKLGPIPTQDMDAPRLRKIMRRRRIALTSCQRRRAANAVLCHLRRQCVWTHAKKIALYLDAFGEVPTHHLIAHCFAMGKLVYLPVVRVEGQPLRWARVTRRQWQTRRLTRHYFGMHQPLAQRGVSVRDFDCLIMPLLAVDDAGHRLGMGGGFYDRTLAFTTLQRGQGGIDRSKPYRIGLAYDFQRVQKLATNPWDVRLNALLTPTAYLPF